MLIRSNVVEQSKQTILTGNTYIDQGDDIRDQAYWNLLGYE